jgi:hypothetical protein
MPVKPLYLDFFEFLGQLGKEDPWLSYQRLYIQPHRKFFEAYWKTFDYLAPPQIAARVRKIKGEDYGQLRSLVQSQDPAVLAEEALQRCRVTLPLNPEPLVYLFVGFFSADGATLEVEGCPSIALGLERFKDFKDLSLLVSHEYCHCAQRSFLKNFFPPQERPLFFHIVAEGLSVLFSEVVYPEFPLHRHLLLTPERLQWCQENHAMLLELAGADLASEKLVPIFFGPGDANAGLPPRIGYFVARQMLGHCLTHHGVEDFGREFPGFEELFRTMIQESKIQLSKVEKR